MSVSPEMSELEPSPEGLRPGPAVFPPNHPPARKGAESFTEDFGAMLQIVFFNGLGMFFMEFLVPFISITVLGASGVEIGLLTAFQIFGYLISTFSAGFLTDKSSKTRIILVGSFGRGIAYIFFFSAILAKTLWLIGFSTFTLGFGAGFFWVPFNALIADKSAPDSRSHAYGRKNSAMGFGVMAGAVFGFTVFFIASGAGIGDYVVYSPLLIFALANFYAGFQFLYRVDEGVRIGVPPPAKAPSAGPPSERETGLNNPIHRQEIWSRGLKIGLLYIMVVLVLASVNSSIGRPFVQPFFLANVSSDPNTVLFIYMPGGIFQMLLAARLGKLADRLPPKLSITISSVLGSLFTFLWINTSNPYLVALFWTCDNTIISLGFLVVQNLLSRVTVRYRGRLFGSQETLINLGGIVGPILGGLAWDNLGIRAPFYISVGVELLLIPFYIAAIAWIKPHLTEKTTEELQAVQEAS